MALWSRECPVCADIGWCNDHPIKDHDDMTTKPNEPEGWTTADIDHLDALLDCSGDCDKMLALIAQFRLQSVAAATAGKDRRDPLRDIVFRYIDRMNDVAPECGDPADRILGEFARDVNAVLKAERAALSEAREAGDTC